MGRLAQTLGVTGSTIMDPRVVKLKSTAECKNFAENAIAKRLPELAEQARRRSVQIRAGIHGASSPVETECLEAVYAYEEVLSAEKGRRQPASRTWQMLKRHGIVPGVERVVTKREVSTGFTALAKMGLMEFAFEAVVLRHQNSFSAEAIAISKSRLEAQ